MLHLKDPKHKYLGFVVLLLGDMENKRKQIESNICSKHDTRNSVSSITTITIETDAEHEEGIKSICGRSLWFEGFIGSRIHLQQVPVDVPVTRKRPSCDEVIHVISWEGTTVQTTNGSLNDMKKIWLRVRQQWDDSSFISSKTNPHGKEIAFHVSIILTASKDKWKLSNLKPFVVWYLETLIKTIQHY